MARYSNPVSQYLNGSGVPLPGNKLSFFEPGTTTFKNTFTDSGLGTPNTNPVIADSEGRISDIWLDGIYKVKLTDTNDVVIWTRDPVGDIVEGQWATYLNDKTYNIPDIVEGSNKEYYRSLTDANQGNDPISSPTKWEKLQLGRLYNANITYGIGDSSYGSDGALYFSITASNLNHDPISDTTATNWRADSSTAYLKVNTALSNADATLTAAQLIGGEFTITPTVARTQTTDTAANIIAAFVGSINNSNFEFTIVNLAAFDVSIAAGVGVTLVGSMIVNNGSATFRARRLTPLTVSITRLESGVFSLGYMHVRDEKSVGSNGGSSSAGINTRILNTVVTNTIVGASLSSNQITLPAGTYRIKGSSPAFNSNQFKTFLYNVTTSSLLLAGTSEYNIASGDIQTRSQLSGQIIISAESAIEFRMYITSAKLSNGLGVTTNTSAGGIEVYTTIEIEKEV